MGKLSNTWAIMGASWEVLKKDKEILVFPIISFICCSIVTTSFAIPLVTSGAWHPPGKGAGSGELITYYGILFLFYFCNYLVITFSNTAVVACATIRMRGGDPTLSDGLGAAVSRLPLIAGWALIAATVGLVLRMIEEHSDRISRLIVGLLGVTWTAMSFLVVPIMVIEKQGPITALTRSTALLKKTWGEQLIGYFSYGLVFFVLGIPGFLLFVAGMMLGNGTVLIVCIGLAILYFIALSLVHSALQAIFQSAVFLYARHGRVPQGFEQELLQNAMTGQY